MFEFKTDQDRIDLFCSELGSNDWNPLHDAEKFKEQGLAEKTNFKKPIVPGMYELLVCELMLKERGYVSPVMINSKFNGEINIGESIYVKDDCGAEKKVFNLAGYSAERGELCFKTLFDYRYDVAEIADKTEGMLGGEKRKVCEIEIDKNNLEIILASVNRKDKDWTPGMLYPSCLISRSLLELNKEEEKSAIYRNLLFWFHKRVEDIGFGKFAVYVGNPDIKPIKRKNVDIVRKIYCLNSYSERNGLCLSAKVELIFS